MRIRLGTKRWKMESAESYVDPQYGPTILDIDGSSCGLALAPKQPAILPKAMRFGRHQKAPDPSTLKLRTQSPKSSVHPNLYVSLHTYIHVSVYIYIYAYTYFYIYICIYTCIHIRMYTYIHVHVYLYICIPLHVHICICMHMYSHNNTEISETSPPL